MTVDTIFYTCEECHHLVEFYPGFTMTCQTRPGHPSHAFTPPTKD